MRGTKSMTFVLPISCLSISLCAFAVAADRKICDTLDLSKDSSFASQQWQSTIDGGCGESGILKVITPSGTSFKLYEHEGAKCEAYRRGDTLQIIFNLDLDSDQNCQLSLTRNNKKKA